MSKLRVSEALSGALKRSEDLRTASPRKVRARLAMVDQEDFAGVRIRCTFRPETMSEFPVQLNAGYREITWAELEDNPARLIQLIEDAVAEVETTLKACAPAAPNPWSREDDRAVEDLAETVNLRCLAVAEEFLEGANLALKRQVIIEALTFGMIRATSRICRASSAMDLRFIETEIRRTMGQMDQEAADSFLGMVARQKPNKTQH